MQREKIDKDPIIEALGRCRRVLDAAGYGMIPPWMMIKRDSPKDAGNFSAYDPDDVQEQFYELPTARFVRDLIKGTEVMSAAECNRCLGDVSYQWEQERADGMAYGYNVTIHAFGLITSVHYRVDRANSESQTIKFPDGLEGIDAVIQNEQERYSSERETFS